MLLWVLHNILIVPISLPSIYSINAISKHILCSLNCETYLPLSQCDQNTEATDHRKYRIWIRKDKESHRPAKYRESIS